MPTVLDVARYIVKKLDSMTTMKLQKLTYYCQAWHLAWLEEPLFNEDFQAWANGPVCPELYERHHGIYRVDSTFLSDIPDYDFTKEQIEAMDTVLDYYGDKEPHWLSELTHLEYPWRNARMGVVPGEPSHNIISKEDMMMYYGGLSNGKV